MSNQEIQLLLGGKKDYSLLGSDGITHPNWGIESTFNNFNIEYNLLSDTLYRYTKMGIANGATWGNRYSFCISNTVTDISNTYIVISSSPASGFSASTLPALLPSNNFYYSSIDNKYYTNFSNGTLPGLYIYPNIHTNGGQIYFRIEQDGKIFSGYSKNTASLIGTGPTSGNIYVGIVTKQTSGTGSGSFKMIPYTISNPAPSSLPVVYDNTILKLPNNDITQTVTTTALNKYLFDYRTAGNVWANNRWGNDRYYIIGTTYNGNSVNIGFFTYNADPLVTNQFTFESNTSVLKPYAYYNSSTGQCIIGTTVLATLSPNLTNVFLRIDRNCNFYVGTSLSSNTLIGNMKTYLNFTSPVTFGMTYGVPFGYEVFSSTNVNTVFNLIDTGFAEVPSTDIHGYTYPNFNERQQNISTTYSSLQQTFVFSTSNYERFTNITFPGNTTMTNGKRYSFTIKCITGGMSEWGIVIGNNTLSFSTTVTTFNQGFSVMDYVSYQSINNSYYASGNVLVSQPSPSPNITTTNGQIYFRIEPDGKIYSGFNQASATLVKTISLTGGVYATLVLKGPTSGTYRFIENN